MDVRTRTEEIERLTLAPWATFSDASRGRQRPEEQDPIRPVFQRDRDRVLHCKAFRRLKQKTQVFLSPEGDLYRTRLTHTLEVSQIARTIARALRLNEDLTEAISLAHDLGHTPFGHAGERALDKLTPGGFKHYMQSLRVVDKLEKDGQGLNLTWEVRNGIVTHTKGTWAATPEGRIVRMADQIAYVNHDIEDAVRAGVLDPATLPKDCTAVLGQTKSASSPCGTSCMPPCMWTRPPRPRSRRWTRSSGSCTSIIWPMWTRCPTSTSSWPIRTTPSGPSPTISAA